MTTALKNIYQSVTDQIIAALEAGTPPWICPWQGSDADMAAGQPQHASPLSWHQ
jgi:antirestriction protein ArdC